MSNNKIIVSQWVSNFIGVGLFSIFACSVITALCIAFLQVGANWEYAPEFTGIVNNIIVYLLWVFSGIVWVLWWVKKWEEDKAPEEMMTLPNEPLKPRFTKTPLTPTEPALWTGTNGGGGDMILV